MRFVGGLIGLALSLFVWAVTATVLGVVVIGGPVEAFLRSLGRPSVGLWIVIAVTTLVVATLLAYVLGAVTTVKLMRATAVAGGLPAYPVER